MWGRRKKVMVGSGRSRRRPSELTDLAVRKRSLEEILAKRSRAAGVLQDQLSGLPAHAPYLERLAASHDASGDRDLAGRC